MELFQEGAAAGALHILLIYHKIQGVVVKDVEYFIQLL